MLAGMRAFASLLGSWVLVSLGCGGSTKDPASAGVGAGGSSAGEPAVSGGRAGMSASGAENEPGGTSGAEAGGAAGLVDCDARKIVCKRAAPQCGTSEVPSVEGNCYGECVKIDRCACTDAEQCPESNQYTCWSKTHCGPFVR